MAKRTFVLSIYRRVKLNGNTLFQHIQSLTDDDLERLFEYADRAIRAEEFNTGLNFPLQVQKQDVVLIVIEKMLQGTRGAGYDPNKGPIQVWIKGSIISEVRNMIRLKSSTSELEKTDSQGEDQPEKEWFNPEQSTPERVQINEEKSSALWGVIYNLVERDSDLVELVKALEDGFDLKNSQELAEALRWDIDRVNNAKKRFFRKIQKSEDDFRSIL